MVNLKQLTNGNYYIYQVDDGGCGIVKAENEDKARLKVAYAYHRHGQPDIHSCNVEVFKIDPQGYQEDCPYVVELGWNFQPN